MRITIVVTRGDDVGGAQIYLRDLVTQLRSDGHEVVVVTGPTGRFTEQLEELGITTMSASHMRHRLHPLFDILTIFQLRSIIRQTNPDLVSLHSSKAGLLGRVAARLAGKPVVFTVHGWSFTPGIAEPQRTLYAVLERFLARLVDRFICVSDWSFNLGLENGIPGDKMTMIHNGIPDSVESFPQAKADSGFHVVMIARFAPPKRHDLLVKAAANLDAVHIHFIGEGPLRGRVGHLASELGIADRVHFHGYQPGAEQDLEQYDAFVLLSDHEGFPLSTLEAMRAGLPVIVSNAGGAPEAVTEGKTGFIVDNNDLRKLSNVLQELIEHPERARSMGEAGRHRMLSDFSFAAMYKRTMNVYQDAAQPTNETMKR